VKRPSQHTLQFIFIVCGSLVIFASILTVVTSLHKPFYVFIGNDEEQDYLGQAIKMHETGEPGDFRHPGLLPKTILYWSLKKGEYTVENVSRAFRTAKNVGFVWTSVCLIAFLFLIRPYIRDVSPLFFLVILFISPSTFYWLLKYGSNFFSFGMYVLLIGILTRTLTLDENERFDLRWITAAMAAFGFGTAIRVTFILNLLLRCNLSTEESARTTKTSSPHLDQSSRKSETKTYYGLVVVRREQLT